MAVFRSHRTPQNTWCHHLRVSSTCHLNCRGGFSFQPWMHLPESSKRQSPRQSSRQCRQCRTSGMRRSIWDFVRHRTLRWNQFLFSLLPTLSPGSSAGPSPGSVGLFRPRPIGDHPQVLGDRRGPTGLPGVGPHETVHAQPLLGLEGPAHRVDCWPYRPSWAMVHPRWAIWACQVCTLVVSTPR